MKALLTAFLIISCTIAVNAQPKKFIDGEGNVVKRAEASYYRQTKKVRQKDGTILYKVQDHFLSGELQMTGQFSDKKLTIEEGLFVFYDVAGWKASENQYLHGKPEGKWLEYHPNGNVSVEMVFINSGNECKSTGYYADGGVHYETTLVNGEVNGSFVTYHPKGTIASKTIFANNKREGKATSWYEDGKIMEEGNFTADKREGDNRWYFQNGQVASKEIYKADSLLSFELYNADGTRDLESGTTVYQAEFPGGMKALYKWLGQNMVYPRDAVEIGIEGTVYVQFTLTAEGVVEKPVIIRPADPLLNEEALRVVTLMPAWKPAKLHGLIMSSTYNLPVVFRLQ